SYRIPDTDFGGWIGLHRFFGMYVVNHTEYGEGQDDFGPFANIKDGRAVFDAAIAVPIRANSSSERARSKRVRSLGTCILPCALDFRSQPQLHLTRGFFGKRHCDGSIECTYSISNKCYDPTNKRGCLSSASPASTTSVLPNSVRTRRR